MDPNTIKSATAWIPNPDPDKATDEPYIEVSQAEAEKYLAEQNKELAKPIPDPRPLIPASDSDGRTRLRRALSPADQGEDTYSSPVTLDEQTIYIVEMDQAQLDAHQAELDAINDAFRAAATVPPAEQQKTLLAAAARLRELHAGVIARHLKGMGQPYLMTDEEKACLYPSAKSDITLLIIQRSQLGISDQRFLPA